MSRGLKNELSLSNLSMHALTSHPENSTEAPLRHALRLKAAFDKEVGFTMDPSKNVFTGFAMEGIVWDESDPSASNSPVSKVVLQEAKSLPKKSTWSAINLNANQPNVD